ncbi:hypothetical protein NO559_01160 [Dasania sp. GY-MA-18]|uniref:DUF1795 domain-containing protein n=1 Tax=Dasania phycosphaerae TaxID=2950436 RepID=A0A9J6RH62_9GAMM|nr:MULTISPECIES: hypothetical protein [Dasania]MCR8921359.1 hypothetical protein [Dasania sp. GY-MA-18]MCZ0863787.1 hypothetical protein [Dasania phycosphaerae]MCZ0867515.1 hypothetical protein [Dasania phycosphaerae]
MKVFTIIFISLLSSLVTAEPAKFEQYGFSIDLLDDKPSPAGSQPLQMFLPPSNGFAANVNVQIQAYPGSIDDYIKLSEAQFKQMGLTIVSSSKNDDTLHFEYSGNMNGQNLHFYAKAVKRGSYFYLATATDSKINWPMNKSKLIQSVNSFKVP